MRRPSIALPPARSGGDAYAWHMSYFVVEYVYAQAPEALDRIRPSHREFLASLVGDILVASGPLVDAPEPGALLIFEAGSADEVLEQLDSDPFWEAELIAERTVTEWNPVVGSLA